MARKKKIKISEEVEKTETEEKINKFQNKETIVSVILGALVVIVIGVLVFNYFKRINRENLSNPQEIKNTNLTPTPKVENNSIKETSYKIQENDTLWSISEKFYQDGFSWKEIAKANKISNPEEIEKGMVIKIPKIETKKETVKGDINGNGVSVSGPKAITASTYTVISGDDLWDIAVRACGDGYRWVKIADDNKLSNPDIIHSGNVLKIQCK